MQDIGRYVLISVGTENLASSKRPRQVCILAGGCADKSEVGTGLSFAEHDGGGIFA